MSMDLGELCLWPLENLADSNSDKKGKLKQVGINEIPAQKIAIRGGGGDHGERVLGKSGKTSIRRPGCDERQAVRIPPADVADVVTSRKDE